MKITIVGGGVIGLSLAWELASRNDNGDFKCDVTLIEKERLGRKASWAGAGILLPANAKTAIHELKKLMAQSHRLHAVWSKRLQKQTGIDNGFQNCGGLYFANSRGEAATLAGSINYWQDHDIEVEALGRSEIERRFPKINLDAFGDELSAAWLPGESQICNPWHLKALVAGCKSLGVRLIENNMNLIAEVDEDRIRGLNVDDEFVPSDTVCFACGSWTQQALAQTGIVGSELSLPMTPVRGQIVLFRVDDKLELPIINEGIRYLVPRTDGHVVAGATVEEVGFDETTNDQDLTELKLMASRFIPELTEKKVVRSWAGLRPGTYDGFPYMGLIPGTANAFVSTGHFKTGLQLSSGSAVAMADLFMGLKPKINLQPFDPSRILSARDR